MCAPIGSAAALELGLLTSEPGWGRCPFPSAPALAAVPFPSACRGTPDRLGERACSTVSESCQREPDSPNQVSACPAVGMQTLAAGAAARVGSSTGAPISQQ